MRWHSTDYKECGGDVRGALLNRGFWLYCHRPLLACRLLGHRPVIDGTEGYSEASRHRWVCCDRCGTRPSPQGDLDPDAWDIGKPAADLLRLTACMADPAGRWPGGWPARGSQEATIGGQLVIGGYVTTGIGFKVGNKGSEHVLAAHACLTRLGGLYLHTEGFGTWLQRRLNPAGYESRVTEVSACDGRLYWRLWAPRDHMGGQKVPRWQDGSLRIDPRDILLGEKRYSYEDASERESAVLRMPDGSAHSVLVRLQREEFGRRRGRKRPGYVVHFETRGDGVPYRSDRGGGMQGWSVRVSGQAVEAGLWRQEAMAATIMKVAGLRVRYEYRDPEQVRP